MFILMIYIITWSEYITTYWFAKGVAIVVVTLVAVNEQPAIELGRGLGLDFGWPKKIHKIVTKPDSIPAKAP